MPANSYVDIQQMFATALEHHRAGRLTDAEQHYRQILAAEPGHADALHAFGVLARQSGRNPAAVELFRSAIQFKPEFVEAHASLGAALSDLGNFDEAVAACNTAIRLNPDYPEAHYNLGTSLASLGRHDEAVVAYKMAIKLRPDYAKAYSNLGAAFERLGQFEGAVAACRTAIRLKPDHTVAHFNLGVSLAELGRFDEAIAALAAATRLKPDFAEAHYQESLIQLLLGRYAIGWPKFEWRWQGHKPLTPRRFSQPQWQGEDISGRAILLHTEQGRGDTIQFARYASLVAARGGRVILATHASLHRLFSELPGVERLIAFGDPLPALDYHCPLMSVPGILGTTVDTIPENIPYLQAEGALVEKWRARIGPAGFRIGIAWQGNANAVIDRGRSVPLSCFIPLAKIPGVRLVSLQKGHGVEQIERLPADIAVQTLGEEFDGGPDAFIDTAAAMMSLDLIITSDTSIFHLAGALGRPVWVALKTVPYWMFMTDRRDNPWYPSARLFRQTERGGWEGVFRQITTELTEHMEETKRQNNRYGRPAR